MKQDEYSTAKQFWKAGATDVQQLNPGLPDQRLIKYKLANKTDCKVERCMALISATFLSSLRWYESLVVYIYKIYTIKKRRQKTFLKKSTFTDLPWIALILFDSLLCMHVILMLNFKYLNLNQ